MSDYEDPLTDHNYDGIQEYDNQLPRWWVYLFIGTILWSAGYLYYFHIGDIGDSLVESYSKEYEMEKDRLDAIENQIPQKSENELAALINDPKVMNLGQVVFISKCAACHADDGGGLVGPNLADEYWLHGNQLVDIRNVVLDGVPEKGMVPWKSLLPLEEIDAVTAYVKTLEGKKVINPKAPQGERIIGQ